MLGSFPGTVDAASYLGANASPPPEISRRSTTATSAPPTRVTRTGRSIMLLPPVWRAACLPGRIFLTGHDIVPSTKYEVVAECGAFLSVEGTASTCLWADVNCDGFVNVTDVQLLQLGFQGIFEFATLIQLDIHPCYPQGIINVSDIQRVVLAIQGQTYDEIGCPVPCPF